MSKMPAIGKELYEHYASMSAQTHEALVKEYAKYAVDIALSNVPVMSKIPQEAIERAETIADAIELADWSGVSIGNKAILKSAIIALRADAARAQGVEVAVKPLEWSDNMAVTPFGSYTVAENIADKWEWTFHEYPYGQASDDTFDTIEEAKSAAQADYEQRIRSALTTPPAPQPTEREKVLEEALRDLVSWFSGRSVFHQSLVDKARAALAGGEA